jgi:cell division protease FtsH
MAQAKKPNPIKTIKMPKKKVAKPGPKKQLTRSQRILRGPLFWIIAAIVGVTVFGQVTNAGNQYTQIKTSEALDAISRSDVESAVLVDKDQKLRLELKAGKTINGSSKVVASYVVRQEPTVIDALTGNPPPKGWTVDVPKQSLFFSLLFSLFPILLIGALFFFLMSRAQGGGKVFSFGRSRAKLQDPDVP